jgi:hypothetical protein
MTMADAITELAAQCAADRPSCVLLIWERAEHGPGPPGKVTVEIRSLPASLAVTRGLYEAIGELLYPGERG